VISTGKLVCEGLLAGRAPAFCCPAILFSSIPFPSNRLSHGCFDSLPARTERRRCQ
jgi:hypothetical protein